MNRADQETRELLYSLGVTEKYAGFFYTAVAVHLAACRPERLALITKWLYPDVAKQFRTDWRNVERGIRAAAEIAWELRPDKLAEIAKRDLDRRPTNSQFITILVSCVHPPADDCLACILSYAS